MRTSVLNLLQRAPQPGWRASLRQNLESVREGIRLDVEDLLNTRRSADPRWEESFPQAYRSVLTYGMDDTDDLLLQSNEDRQTLEERFRRAIEAFEPRLSSVAVRIVEAPRMVTQEIVLEVEATIRVVDEEEHVVWSSIVRGDSLELLEGG